MVEPERMETRRAVLLVAAAAAVGARFFAAGVLRGNHGGVLLAAEHPFPPLLGTAVGVWLAIRVGFIRRPTVPFARRVSIRPFAATFVGALIAKSMAALAFDLDSDAWTPALAFDSYLSGNEWIPALLGTLIWDVALYGIAASSVLDMTLKAPPTGDADTRTDSDSIGVVRLTEEPRSSQEAGTAAGTEPPAGAEVQTNSDPDARSPRARPASLLLATGALAVLALGWLEIQSQHVSDKTGNPPLDGVDSQSSAAPQPDDTVDPVASYCRLYGCAGFYSTFTIPPDAGEPPPLRLLRESALLEETATALNRVITLPERVELLIRKCGAKDAQYDPARRRVSLCEELIEEISREFTRAVAKRGAGQAGWWENKVLSASTFFLYHEIAHAAIHLLQLPVTGRTEDGADQLAVKMLLHATDTLIATDALLAASAIFESLSDDRVWDADGMSGVHPLPPQRWFNLHCWRFALDPTPESRRILLREYPTRFSQCDQEWAQISSSWDRLLSAHRRTGTQ